MMLAMTALQLPPMPKKEEKRDEDKVRLVARMRREDRNRLRAYAAIADEDMEVIVVRWLMDRLAQEEKKLGR